MSLITAIPICLSIIETIIMYITQITRYFIATQRVYVRVCVCVCVCVLVYVVYTDNTPDISPGLQGPKGNTGTMPKSS